MTKSQIKKLKILMVGTSLKTKGGVSRVVLNYLGSNLINEVIIKYIPTHIDHSIVKKIVAAIFGYAAFFFNLFYLKPEIIHLHVASRGSFYRKTPIIILSKLFRKKVIYHHHGGEFMIFYQKESGIIAKKFIRIILNLPDIIIVLSQKWKDNFLNIMPSLPINILPNPVSCNNPIARFDNETPNILFMGNIIKEKGIEDLFEASRYLKNKNIQFKIILCGTGDIRYWENRAAELNISNRIIFKGWVSGIKKNKIIISSDICVLPSYNEGLPMFILESLAYGLPVIATNVGGVPETVFNNINGFLVSPGDVGSLAESMKVLIENKSLRKQYGQNSRKIAQEKFEISVIKEKLLGLYMEL